MLPTVPDKLAKVIASQVSHFHKSPERYMIIKRLPVFIKRKWSSKPVLSYHLGYQSRWQRFLGACL
jgi:hypothetical protein